MTPIGYEFVPGRLIVKLFAGVEGEDQQIVPHDPNNSVQGSALGLLLQAESWLDPSARSFLSLDASYGTAFQDYWSRSRLGYRLTLRFSLGLEGGALGNEEYDAGRGGGFARVNLRVDGSHSVRRLYRQLSGRRSSGYVALGLYRPFQISRCEGRMKVHCRPRSGSAWLHRLRLVCRERPAREGGNALLVCILCKRDVLWDVPVRLSPATRMTQRRQRLQMRVQAYPHFLFLSRSDLAA